MLIFVYNENCIMAGKAVPVRIIDKYDDPNDVEGWHAEEVSYENARHHESPNGGTPDSYHSRIAEAIRSLL